MTVCDGQTNNTLRTFVSGTAWSMFAGGQITGTNATTSWTMLGCLWNGVSSKMWFNGGTPATGDPGAITTAFVLGAAGGGVVGFTGDVAVAGIWTATLAQINELGTGYATKYGLTWTTAT